MYSAFLFSQELRQLRRSITIVAVTLCVSALMPAQESQWVRPSKTDDPLVWGRRDGIVFGLASPGGIKGPRGLIRIGVFGTDQSGPQLLNYIAVEPIIQGAGDRFDRMAFSELEMSMMDPGQRGKRMWAAPISSEENNPSSGTMQTLHVGDATIERLSVRIDIEKYTANGAHVYLVASIDSDHPGELRLSTYAEPDSPSIEELTVTATMGNFERLRLLWLKDHVEDSRKLFSSYTGEAFAEGENYPLSEMLRSGEGDAIVFCTPSEKNPKDSPGNNTAHWVYPLPKFTQYWRVPGHDVQPDLRTRVNARRVYWASTAPVLGGIAFENFEVRERFVPGQSFIFGITPKEPWEFYRGRSHLVPQ